MKVRLATVWLGGCAGCHMSFLDLDEVLIDLMDAVEVVYSPVVDVKEYPENVDVCLIEGAVCNEDNLARWYYEQETCTVKNGKSTGFSVKIHFLRGEKIGNQI